MICISMIDYITTTIFFFFEVKFYLLKFPWFATLLRPIELVLLSRNLQKYFNRFQAVIRGSAPMVFFILGYVIYFSWMGFHIFAGNLEGTTTFPTFGNSIWSMFVLLTTANFPDVMLAAYEDDKFMCLFFVLYLSLGLFLFLNLLLAIFYSSY